MACGSCGKRRVTPPAGMGDSRTQQQKQREEAAKAARDAAQTKRSAASQTFELRDRNGRVQTFGSRLQAEAAKVRAGGGSISQRF